MSDSRYHTIIFVPHARARFRQFRVSDRALRWGLAGLALSLTLCLAATVAFFVGFENSARSAELEEENSRLRSANTVYARNLEEMTDRLDDFESQIGRLALLAGMRDSRELGRGGTGGPSEASSARALETLIGRQPPSSLLVAEERSLELARDLELLEARLTEQDGVLAATPTIAPARGLPTSGFGYRTDPFNGRRAFHGALDISAATGTPVVAPASGVVTRAAWENGYGRVVRISHGFGLTTLYGHLSSVDVKAGQRVERGEMIGKVGSTGRSTGTHLHYEVRVDGRPENPLKYILDAF